MRKLKAVSDPTRFKLLKLLQEGTFCVCELTATFGLAQPTISRHLRTLEDAGLVISTRYGQRMDYSLVPDPADGETRELLELVKKWQEDNPEIIQLRRQLEKNRVCC